MFKRCKILAVVTIVMLIGICKISHSYQWPVSPFAGPHPITGTVGEWRNTHLHAGVDIGRGTGTSVYASVGGVIPTGGIGSNYVKVGNIDYVHINLSSLHEGQQINAGDFLGTIDGENHLHLEENDGGANPLRVGGLDNYTDTARTYVSTLEFFRQGTETQLTGTIYGQLDIISLARDAQSNGSATVSVYRMGCQVQNNAGTVVLGPLYNFQFDSVVGGSRSLVYANFTGHQSDRDTYYYWATNTMSENRYWNTKLRMGQQWNGLDARINSEAAYPEGKYKTSVLAFDIQGNGGDIANQEGALTEEIIVDNFRPYVSKVTISSDYQGEWTFDNTNLNFSNSINNPFTPGTYTITIIFSEPVTNATLSIDTFGSIALSSSDPQNNQKTWTGTLTIPSGTSAHDGERTLTISAQDLAGNQILQLSKGTTQINPATQLTRDSSGNMQGIGGNDTVHHKIVAFFNIPTVLIS